MRSFRGSPSFSLPSSFLPSFLPSFRPSFLPSSFLLASFLFSFSLAVSDRHARTRFCPIAPLAPAPFRSRPRSHARLTPDHEDHGPTDRVVFRSVPPLRYADENSSEKPTATALPSAHARSFFFSLPRSLPPSLSPFSLSLALALSVCLCRIRSASGGYAVEVGAGGGGPRS